VDLFAEKHSAVITSGLVLILAVLPIKFHWSCLSATSNCCANCKLTSESLEVAKRICFNVQVQRAQDNKNKILLSSCSAPGGLTWNLAFFDSFHLVINRGIFSCRRLFSCDSWHKINLRKNWPEANAGKFF